LKSVSPSPEENPRVKKKVKSISEKKKCSSLPPHSNSFIDNRGFDFFLSVTIA